MMLFLKFLIVFVVTWVLSDFLDVDDVNPAVIVGVAILITVFVSIFQLGSSVADEGATQLTELVNQLE